MNNCEIVDNVACGKSFQYCRTHKVEPQNCPGAKQLDSGSGDFADALSYAVAAKLIAPKTKRGFKAGDKVKVIGKMTFAAAKLHGQICTIAEVRDNVIRLSEDNVLGPGRAGGVFDEEVEHV